MSTIRLIARTMAFHEPTYREIAANPHALFPAYIIVIISSFIVSLTTFKLKLMPLLIGGGIGLVISIALWYALAGIVYRIAFDFFSHHGEKPSFKALLRTLGFARAPYIFHIFSFCIPMAGGIRILSGIISLWTFGTMIVAVKASIPAINYTKSFLLCMAGFAMQLVLQLVFTLLLMRALA